MIADSDPFNLGLLQEACESAGYEVIVALTGPEVLDAVARLRPHVVLLHAGLAKMDGLEVIGILKADERLAHIPIICATAADDEEKQQQSLDAGAIDYVVRPYRVFEVQRRIRVAIRSTRTIPPPMSIVPPPSASQLQLTVEYELTRAQRYGHELSCVVVVAEKSPALLAEVRDCIRAVDQLFHTDDGYVVLLPETDAAGADVVRNRMGERTASVDPGARVGHGTAHPELSSGADLVTLARDTIEG